MSEMPQVMKACIQGKHSRPPFGKSSRAASEPLERIHLDRVGPISPPAITRERYFVTVVDEATHYVLVLAMKSKDAISGSQRTSNILAETVGQASQVYKDRQRI
jgi:hypothetical protein